MPMTNVFSRKFILSHRLKGKWSLWRRQGFHSTLLVLFTLRRHSTSLSTFGIIFTLITHSNGEKWGSQTTPFLAINAKGGENMSPKQKDRTTTNFKKFLKNFFNWYLIFDIFQIGMTSFKNWYLKPS
jgi:hypothetical protein